jgi:hypothetical protein
MLPLHACNGETMTARHPFIRAPAALAVLLAVGAMATLPSLPLAAQPSGASGAARADQVPSLFRDPRRPLPKPARNPPVAAETEAGASKVDATAPTRSGPAPPTAPCEGVPTLAAEPVVGGRVRLALEASCAAGRPVVVAYGGIETEHAIGPDGKASIVVDAFLGSRDPIVVRLSPDWSKEVPVTKLEGERVSKAAIVWSGPVDLNLHAFEAAAAPGERGHVWSGAPSSADEAERERDGVRRSRGFFGRVGKGHPTARAAEIYTVLHAPGEPAGVVELAVVRAGQGEGARRTDCAGSTGGAEVAFELVLLAPDGSVTRRRAALAAIECEQPASREARFDTDRLPRVRLGQ